MSKKNGKKWALRAAVAAAAGYVTGVLSAPKSGKETRKDIEDTAKKSLSRAEQELKDIHTQLDSVSEEAKKRANELTGKAKQEIDSTVEESKQVRDKASEVLQAVRDGKTDDVDLKKALAEAEKALKDLKKFLNKE